MRTKIYAITSQTVNTQLLASVNGQAATTGGAIAASQPTWVGHAALAAAQEPVATVGMTLTALATLLSQQGTITLTSVAGGSLVATNFAIVGTDELGNAVTETLAGPGVGLTVTSVQQYDVITSITPDTTSALATVSAGVTNPALTLAANPVSVAAGQALGGGAMALAAAGVLATPSKITLSSGVDVSAIAFAIVGKDNLGNTISESLLGPHGTAVGSGIVTVTSVKTYTAITSITPGANAAQVVGAGSLVTFASPAKLVLADSGDGHLVTFVIVGTNAAGGAQTSSAISVPTPADTVTTTQTWGSVTSITPSVTSAIDFTADVAAGNSITAGVNVLAAPYVFGTQKTFTGFNGTPPQGVPMEVTVTQLAGGLANTYTITGVDRWGIASISEVITAAATTAATYRSKCVYSKVTSIVPSVSDTSATGFGVPARVTTPWVQLNQTRGFDQTELGHVTVDSLVGTPVWTLEETSASINEQGLGPHGWNDNSYNLPTYVGDNAPIDTTSTPTFTVPAPFHQGSQWVRLVNTAVTGNTAIARFVRPGF